MIALSMLSSIVRSFVFQRVPIVEQLAPGTLGAKPDAGQQLQHAIVQLAGDALPFFRYRVLRVKALVCWSFFSQVLLAAALPALE